MLIHIQFTPVFIFNMNKSLKCSLKVSRDEGLEINFSYLKIKQDTNYLSDTKSLAMNEGYDNLLCNLWICFFI